MTVLFIHSNIYYTCEVLYADGRITHHLFTGAPLKAREAALTCLLEHVLDDEGRGDTFCQVYVHHLKTGEKATVTSSSLLHQPHEGLQQELELYEKEGVKTEKVLYDFKRPQHVTLLLTGTSTKPLKNGTTLLGLAQNWSVTFGRKKTAMNLAA
jgi:hypothetical protein